MNENELTKQEVMKLLQTFVDKQVNIFGKFTLPYDDTIITTEIEKNCISQYTWKYLINILYKNMNKIPDQGLRIIILTAYEENYNLYLQTTDKKYLNICSDMEQAFYKCGGTREFLKETVGRINQDRLNKYAAKLKMNN